MDTTNLRCRCRCLRDLGLRDAEDEEIFHAAKQAAAVVMTKDSDFLRLLERHGPPPQVLWLTCGNTTNAHLKEILSATLPDALTLLEAQEKLIEISDAI
jgi:predicted nuclease of predicted toxin-antitoxin system